MINALLNGIFSLITNLVQLILYPIDLVISNFLPGVNDALVMVSNFLNWSYNGIAWVWSWTGFNSIVKSLFLGYLVFKYTVPFTVHTIKLAIQWYDKLKP